MRDVRAFATEALDSVVMHGRDTSLRIERARQREQISMELLAIAKKDLIRSRTRLAELAARMACGADEADNAGG